MLLLVVGVLAAPLVSAQVQIPAGAQPGAIQQRSIEEQRRKRQEERPTPSSERPVQGVPAPAVRIAPGAEKVRFFVRKIEFSPSAILSSGELKTLAANYSGREATLAELQTLVAKVNDLYRSKGIVTAQAVLPPQDVKAGVVHIRLVEGRVGEFVIEGNATTNADFVRNRIHQHAGDLVDLKDIEQDLIRFNRTQDAQARAQLRPGKEFGRTDVVVKLAEPERQSLRAFLDNNDSDSSGKWRRGLAYLNRSVFGFRDDLNLTLVNASGHQGYSAAYGFPVNTWGGRLDVAYYHDRTQVVSGAFSALGIRGKAQSTLMTLRQPIAVHRDYQIDGLAGFRDSWSKVRIGSVPLQKTQVRTGWGGVELQSADTTGSWLAALNYQRGHAWSSSSRSFGLWRGNVHRGQRLGRGFSGLVNLSAQYSSDVRLPSSEQFFLGGDGSVRGYATGLFGGDKGYTLNLELHHPLPESSGSGGRLSSSGYAFFDFGRTSPYRPVNSGRGDDVISSVGLGLNFSLGKVLTGHLALARGLHERVEEPDRFRLYLQIIVDPIALLPKG